MTAEKQQHGKNNQFYAGEKKEKNWNLGDIKRPLQQLS